MRTPRRSFLRAASMLAAPALLVAPTAAHGADRPVGFYVPWDPASLVSVQTHADELSVVVPTWISVTGADHQLTVVPDEAGHAALAALPHRPALWLMVQNAARGSWDGGGAASLLADPAASGSLLGRLEALTLAERARGLVIDFEGLAPDAVRNLVPFLRLARAITRRHGWTLAITVPAADPAWDLAAIGRVADRVILMAYDQHWQTGSPGPIAAEPWFRSVVAAAVRQVPARRLIVGIAAYAYDWLSTGPATTLSIDQARRLARSSDTAIQRDPASGAAHFAYRADGEKHQVWLADATTVAAQHRIVQDQGVTTTAIWRLGTEDEAQWRAPKP